jgi:glutamyl-tRNA reductase
MSIVVVGVNHRTAPIELLERLSISDEKLPKALLQLGNYEHVLEGAILSTCNRVEVYAVVSKFHGGAQDLKNFLAEFCHVAPEEFSDQAYTYHDEAALRHLFRVASGTDSMVVGESEILGQVRRAFQAALDEGTLHRVLGAAARQAYRVGKRARTETSIGRNPVSISSAAIDLARKAFDGRDLSERAVAIVGAGKMGGLAARALKAAGASDITVVNRSEERGQVLAETFAGRARAFEELVDVLVESDIVICSTTAHQIVIDKQMMETAMSARRKPGPLFVVDIAVPRDVSPSVTAIPNVVLRDIDDLKGIVESNRDGRLNEVTGVEEIIDAELDHFLAWERSTEVEPTISALLAKAATIRLDEVEKTAGRRRLTESERAAMDQMTTRIVAKLLHEPIDKVRKLSTSKQGHVYAAALRELFGLDDEPTP